MQLPDDLRDQLKTPLGNLVSDNDPNKENIIKKISAESILITVDGEEDLLVIPACIFAPENSVVMYGQPNEGLVIVTITPELRAKVQKILDAMN